MTVTLELGILTSLRITVTLGQRLEHLSSFQDDEDSAGFVFEKPVKLAKFATVSKLKTRDH